MEATTIWTSFTSKPLQDIETINRVEHKLIERMQLTTSEFIFYKHQLNGMTFFTGLSKDLYIPTAFCGFGRWISVAELKTIILSINQDSLKSVCW